MNRTYRSVYGEHLAQFIQMKQQFGFKYRTGAVILSQLDRLATERNEKSEGITQDFSDAWGKERPNESENYRYDRILYLIRFSSYLTDLGISSYIPRPFRPPRNTFIPYIYSHSEVRALFKACDELRIRNLQMNSSLISMPVLLRLLYSTGIRIGEALDLKDKDVNLEHGWGEMKERSRSWWWPWRGREKVFPGSMAASWTPQPGFT